MRSTSLILVVSLACSVVAACDGGGKQGAGSPKGSAAASAATSASASAAPAASASAAPEASASAAPSESAAASAKPIDSNAGSASTSGATAGAGSAAAGDGKKKFDCGSKGQKACPMQGWMKGVMARAVASGDGAKIASALDTIAAKPVAGYDQWSGVAADGAAKARAGDIAGAKASCKKCHQLYQKKYKQTLRDQPW